MDPGERQLVVLLLTEHFASVAEDRPSRQAGTIECTFRS